MEIQTGNWALFAGWRWDLGAIAGLPHGRCQHLRNRLAIRGGAQDTVNQAGQQIIQRQLQVAPTLTIRPGFPVRIIVTRDLVLEPYRS